MGNSSGKRSKRNSKEGSMDGETKQKLSTQGKELFRKTLSQERAAESDAEQLASKLNAVSLSEKSEPAAPTIKRESGKSSKGGSYRVTVPKASSHRGVGSVKERTLLNEMESDSKIAAPSINAAYPSKKWTEEQDEALCQAVEKYKGKNWKAIAECVPGRTHVQCLQRWRKVLQPGLKKGHWTEEEDNLLISLVSRPGENLTSWVAIAKHIPGRTAKQCRERWSLNLDPDIKRGPWEPEEDQLLMDLHSRLGNKWAEISGHMNGRTENAVKTRYKSLVRAAQKEWTPEEDQIIINAKQNCNNRWASIANMLPNRSKNAVRLRWKHLVTENPELEVGVGSVEVNQLIFGHTMVKTEVTDMPRPRPMQVTSSDTSTLTHASNQEKTLNTFDSVEAIIGLEEEWCTPQPAGTSSTYRTPQPSHFVPQQGYYSYSPHHHQSHHHHSQHVPQPHYETQEFEPIDYFAETEPSVESSHHYQQQQHRQHSDMDLFAKEFEHSTLPHEVLTPYGSPATDVYDPVMHGDEYDHPQSYVDPSKVSDDRVRLSGHVDASSIARPLTHDVVVPEAKALRGYPSNMSKMSEVDDMLLEVFDTGDMTVA